MPKFLRRKPAPTPLAVLGPVTADDAYDTLPLTLVETTPKALHSLIQSAKAYGITNLGATVVSRMVGPWRTDLQVRSFVQDVEAFLNEGGES